MSSCFTPRRLGRDSGPLRGRSGPVGLYFPEGKLFLEHQRAAVPNALAIEQRHMTSNDAPGDSKQRNRLAKLHFDPYAGQQAPVGFDERAAC